MPEEEDDEEEEHEEADEEEESHGSGVSDDGIESYDHVSR